MPDIEERESRVAPLVAGLVDLAHHRRHVRLEESGADDDEAQPEVEHVHAREREAEMSRGDDQAADHERASRADPAIGEIAADERREVHERRVIPVEPRRVFGVPVERLGEEEHEDRAHPVVREALPHLGGREQRETARVAEERGVVERRGRAGSGSGGSGHVCLMGDRNFRGRGRRYRLPRNVPDAFTHRCAPPCGTRPSVRATSPRAAARWRCRPHPWPGAGIADGKRSRPVDSRAMARRP